MKKLLLAFLIALCPSLAFAGAGTVTIKDSTGTTQTFDVITDGSGHFVGLQGICDQSAAANCVGVDASHNLGASVLEWGGATLGAMANYGTSPGAVLVPGVNAFITNVPAVNVTQFGTTNLSTGTGASGTGIPRVTVSNDSQTPAPSLGTTGGWTTKLLNALNNTAVAVKASGGQLAAIYCWNPNASVAYIQIYNTASGSVTVGTTTPVLSLGIPPTNSSGFTESVIGAQFGTAISVAATTTATGAAALGTAMDCNALFN